MKYTWLLFDADDTLFDFSRAEANALKWTLEQSGLDFEPEHLALYARLNQQVWQEFERGLVSSQELRVKRFRLFVEASGLKGEPQALSPLYLKNLALGTDLHEGSTSSPVRLRNSRTRSSRTKDWPWPAGRVGVRSQLEPPLVRPWPRSVP